MGQLTSHLILLYKKYSFMPCLQYNEKSQSVQQSRKPLCLFEIHPVLLLLISLFALFICCYLILCLYLHSLLHSVGNLRCFQIFNWKFLRSKRLLGQSSSCSWRILPDHIILGYNFFSFHIQLLIYICNL